MKEKQTLPKELRSSVLLGIAREERIRARNYLIFLGVIILFSTTTIFLFVRYMIFDFSQSGFYEYFSLIFSDTDVVAAYWKEFSMSLISSIPFAEITIWMSALLAFLYSLRAFVGRIKISTRLAN